ncbi:hypothetical protein IC607_02595 [Cellulomonas sp. JH27-2]|uniref:FitA-like ribbon-helix-helix domain-containing protein n=1 Tax=Cellulomonas sp. JH27-2 TaxID=2774139 RepID=UPI001785FAA6|nr:hypothetical protein [Cellulomonas sp. JH27-2]MBD8057853.1 hypothetical protein [Cellulomonas sp. JH27-2]
MVMVQIRHVPDEVHRELRARAARQGRSLSDFLLTELTRLADEPTLDSIAERIRTYDLVHPSPDLPALEVVVEQLEEERAARDDQLGAR